MFDKQRIIKMAQDFTNFISNYRKFYIVPELLKVPLVNSVCLLLKRFNANVVAILTDTEGSTKIPAGTYNTAKLNDAIQNFDETTAIIAPVVNPKTGYIYFTCFSAESLNLQVPSFAMTEEEALAIYDSVTIVQLLKQYQSDGIPIDKEEVTHRFARGMSTVLNPQFQNLKIELWDRRELKISSYNVEDTAIVIQGPVEYKDDYTLTTARLYRQWYPNAPIVISTWKDEATENFRKGCAEISVTLLENDLPEYSGTSHLNYQLESSFRGVEYVKNNTDAKFVLKTRADQRINRTDFLLYFKNLLKAYPPKDNKTASRIILLAWTKWWPFYTNDFLYFGDVGDISRLFEQKQTKEEGNYVMNTRSHNLLKLAIKLLRFNPDLKFKTARKLRNFNLMMDKYRGSEIFIMKTFYGKYIGDIDPTRLLQIYFGFLRDYLIVVDEKEILLDYPKYSPIYGHGLNSAHKVKSYYHRGLDHAAWLDIYLNYKDEDWD